jgi:hypothetical protein
VPAEEQVQHKTTNFFQITVTPPIEKLFITDVYPQRRFRSADNVTTYLTKESVASLYPLEPSTSVLAKREHIEWLSKMLIFSALDSSKSLFDINYKEGEVSIYDDKIEQTSYFYILRRVSIRIFHTYDDLVLALDPFVRLYNRGPLNRLLTTHGLPISTFIGKYCLVLVETHGDRRWLRAYIEEISTDDAFKVKIDVDSPSLQESLDVSAGRIIPLLDDGTIASLASAANIGIDPIERRNQLSRTTSKEKLHLTRAIIENYISPLFPIKVRQTEFRLSTIPLNADRFRCLEMSVANEPSYLISRAGCPPLKTAQRLSGLRACLRRYHASQAPNRQMDHGHTDHGATGLGQILIIFR